MGIARKLLYGIGTAFVALGIYIGATMDGVINSSYMTAVCNDEGRIERIVSNDGGYTNPENKLIVFADPKHAVVSTGMGNNIEYKRNGIIYTTDITLNIYVQNAADYVVVGNTIDELNININTALEYLEGIFVGEYHNILNTMTDEQFSSFLENDPDMQDFVRAGLEERLINKVSEYTGVSIDAAYTDHKDTRFIKDYDRGPDAAPLGEFQVVSSLSNLYKTTKPVDMSILAYLGPLFFGLAILAVPLIGEKNEDTGEYDLQTLLKLNKQLTKREKRKRKNHDKPKRRPVPGILETDGELTGDELTLFGETEDPTQVTLESLLSGKSNTMII